MATYAIGDIQGCFTSLERLLAKIEFNAEKDTLWCTGDLVNRGTESLAVLRFFYALGDKHRIVLGNHDLHLLAVAAGTRTPHRTDTLEEVLQAPDKEALLAWLSRQPMLVYDAQLGYVMTHAGLAPSWTLAQAQQLAKEVEAVLQGNEATSFYQQMYGNLPDQWDEQLTGIERIRCVVNYLTRMRYCYQDGRLDLAYKGEVQHKPPGLTPWFEVATRANADVKIIFGHWAALNGKCEVRNVYALDTGCVWGGCLTAMRLEDNERFVVSCPKTVEGAQD